MITMEELLRTMVEHGGSDLHISAGSPPRVRIDGDLQEMTGCEVMGPDQTKRLVYSVLDQEQIARFEQDQELDMSFGLQGVGRFRVNVFFQRGAVGAVLRTIPYEIYTFEQLGVPATVCKQLCDLPQGLVLVTGATGSGKSTTLAAMIDYINATRREHIITIEDPIEFVHRNKNCLVNQREIGNDTQGFHQALKRVLRQDPDVVLIGEMRDRETMEAGLTIAETGHLTFATLHTSDCVQTINRLIDAFPAHQQNQIRVQLSFTLVGVFCQQLLPRATGRGRVMANEIMIPTAAVRALIRDDKCHQIPSIIQTGAKFGMRTMNQSLLELFKANAITWDIATTRSMDPEDLRRMAEREGLKTF